MTVGPTHTSLGIRPVWSEPSLGAHGSLRTQAFFRQTAKTLIRLGLSESSLGAHASVTNISFKVTTDSQATFYPKNRSSLNSLTLFSTSVLTFKNNKKLRLTSGIGVLTLQKYSSFEFWPKIVSYLREEQKIFLRHSLMLMRYIQLVH